VISEQTADDWFAIGDEPLDVGRLYDWAVRPDCGAVVVFSGTVRDHSVEGDLSRNGVTHLDYEAYASEVVPSFREIAVEARRRWPDLGRIALHHRTGRIELSESSVIAVVSAPHRPEAFAAARFAIDALKAGSPIWKHETWEGGSDWGTGSTIVTEPKDVSSVDGAGV
jgi:molybdopterin synthase catalytic subunit